MANTNTGGARQRAPAGQGQGQGQGQGEYTSTLQKLSKLDAFPKVRDADFYSRTVFGGLVTIASVVVMAVLFISEVRNFLSNETAHELFVDTSRYERMTINFDIVFPRLACSLVHIDAMDVGGEQQVDVTHSVFKKRLDMSGEPVVQPGEGANVHKAEHLGPPKLANDDKSNATEYCGSCYGAESSPGECCNTCEQVKEAYRKRGWQFTGAENMEQCGREKMVRTIAKQDGEGCNVYGKLHVNKVAGNFHVAPGKAAAFGNIPLALSEWLGLTKPREFDLSHRINHLSFGKYFPGQKNPLDGVMRGDVQTTGTQVSSGTHQYFIKVVPTVYEPIGYRNGTGSVPAIHSNQYSVTENYHHVDVSTNQVAGVFFFYDLSPIKVRFTERRKCTMLEFITSCFAIIGGVFTVTGLLDSFVYHGHQAVKKKLELGKLS
ncbi:endoplasmic reticulum-Golgi intermediate compartment protein 3 [Pseudoscourfieldia marina]